ncbi:flagellar biosynthetic protein FliR [Thioclava sp. BHET1]|nr:flagellar biosynthetic protein FliR [Thioclava sp. BHET1]
MLLQAFINGQVFGYFLVVARLGSALMFMPAIGEAYVPPRAKLSMILVICLALYPATPVPPIDPDQLPMIARLMATEVTVGLWIGLTARALYGALEFAGYQIGQITGLANAFSPSLGSFQGSTMLATLLMIGGVALIFVTNTHYLIIRALLFSYDIFPFGKLILGDMAQQLVKAVSGSFYIGLMISAPFLVMGLVLHLGMGLANRMMPNLPVFFVAAPLLIAAGLLVFIFALPSMLSVFLSHFSDWLGSFTL